MNPQYSLKLYHSYATGEMDRTSQASKTALQSLRRQEEVLLCYGGWETPFLTHSRMQRREHLQKHWGFHCHCPRCEDEAQEHADLIR